MMDFLSDLDIGSAAWIPPISTTAAETTWVSGSAASPGGSAATETLGVGSARLPDDKHTVAIVAFVGVGEFDLLLFRGHDAAVPAKKPPKRDCRGL